MSKPPRWVKVHVQKCREAFGIGYAGFDFYLHQVDTVDGDNPNVAGNTTTSVYYGRAEVTLRRDFPETDANYEILTHEVLHAATGAQRQAVDQIIALLPERQRTYAEEMLWQAGNEATITQLARALTPLLRAMRPVDAGSALREGTPIEEAPPG